MLPSLSGSQGFRLQVSAANHVDLRQEARRNSKDCNQNASRQRSESLPHSKKHLSESPFREIALPR